MTTYLIIFAVTFLLSIFLKSSSNKTYLRKVIIVFIPILLYGLLRYECNDFFEYEMFHSNAFKNEFFNSINERFEWGYSYLNYILPQFWQVLLVQTVVLIASYCFVAYKYVPAQYLWVFIFLLFLSGEKTIFFLTAMRNTFALAILLFAIPLIKERKLLLYIGATLLAMLFHTSAVVYLPLAFIIGRSTIMKKGELIAWIAVIMVILVTPVETFINQAGLLISGNELEKYASYMESYHENGVLQKMASVIFSGLVLYDLYAKNEEHDGTKMMLGRLALMFFIFPLLGTLNMRGTHYFCIFALLYAVYINRGIGQPLYKNVFFMLLLAYSAYALFIVEASSAYSNFESYKTLIDIK